MKTINSPLLFLFPFKFTLSTSLINLLSLDKILKASALGIQLLDIKKS